METSWTLPVPKHKFSDLYLCFCGYEACQPFHSYGPAVRPTRSKFGIESFDAMIKFAENVKHYVKEVVLSTVSTTLTEEEEKECADICKKIGVTYRIRPFED